MKDTKRRMELFSFYDHTGLEAHLEKMAARGWKLEKITNFYWQYRRIAPQALHFTVAYYPAASAYDPGPSEEEYTFREYCAQAGWELAASAGQMQVFCTAQEDPTPIDTDAAIQVESIHTSMKKTFLPSRGILLLLAVMQMIFLVLRIQSDPIGALSSSSNLLSSISWVVLIFLCLQEIFSYLRWYKKATLAAAEEDILLPTHGNYYLQIALLLILLFAITYWLFSLDSTLKRSAGIFGALHMVALIFLVNGVTKFLKRKKVTSRTNFTLTLLASFVFAFAITAAMTFLLFQGLKNARLNSSTVETYEYKGMTWTIYHDVLPLTIEDLTAVDYDDFSTRWERNESPLVAQYEGTQRPRMDALAQPDLEYTLTTVKVPVLYDLCLNSRLEQFDKQEQDLPEEFRRRMVEQDATLWGADKAYRRYSGEFATNHYLVCWENIILEITFSWEPTPEQMATATQVLRKL